MKGSRAHYVLDVMGTTDTTNMSCYHPLKAFDLGVKPNGKKNLKVCSYGVDHVEEIKNGTYVGVDHQFRSSNAKRCFRDYVEIPCGNCIGCRLEYSRQWANRCMLEMQDHKESWFLTITYDDQHLPRRYYGDAEGNPNPVATLLKRDFQLFIKRLRKAINYPIRYFACGEYGPETFRPHYHCIIFGLHLDKDDLKVYTKDERGYYLFTSDFLDRIWSFPCRLDTGEFVGDSCNAGKILVGHCNWETCAYTARYITKKLTGSEKSFYDDFNIEEPFLLMSRRPGIGHSYYDRNKDSLFDFTYINVSTTDGGKKFLPPKYYHRLFELDFPEDYELLKQSRKDMASYKQDMKLSRTDLNYLDYLSVEEDSQLNKIKSLRRDNL